MKTAEELAAALRDALGDGLRSVVLYGSSAEGEQTRRYSDQNVLAVVADLSVATMKKLAPISRRWIKAGNPAPLLFTERRLREAEDVFPIEFLDITSRHRVLSGDDPFAALEVHTHYLRHQLEYELRGKLIQLRERYLEIADSPARVRDLLARSISTFTVLFRAVLRLLGEAPGTRRADVFSGVGRHVKIDEAALADIWSLRNGPKAGAKREPDELLAALLTAVEDVIDFVDCFDPQKKSGEPER